MNKISFKSFIVERSTENAIKTQAQHLLGLDDVEIITDLNNRIHGNARLAGHKFVDSKNGSWNLKFFKNEKGNAYVEANPPHGSKQNRFYIVPAVSE